LEVSGVYGLMIREESASKNRTILVSFLQEALFDLGIS